MASDKRKGLSKPEYARQQAALKAPVKPVAPKVVLSKSLSSKTPASKLMTAQKSQPMYGPPKPSNQDLYNNAKKNYETAKSNVVKGVKLQNTVAQVRNTGEKQLNLKRLREEEQETSKVSERLSNSGIKRTIANAGKAMLGSATKFAKDVYGPKGSLAGAIYKRLPETAGLKTIPKLVKNPSKQTASEILARPLSLTTEENLYGMGGGASGSVKKATKSIVERGKSLLRGVASDKKVADTLSSFGKNAVETGVNRDLRPSVKQAAEALRTPRALAAENGPFPGELPKKPEFDQVSRSEAPVRQASRVATDTPQPRARTRQELPKRNTNKADELFEEADERGRQKVYVNVNDGSGRLKRVEVGEFDELGDFKERRHEDGRKISDVLDEDSRNLQSGKRGITRSDRPGDARAIIKRGFGTGAGRKVGILGRAKASANAKKKISERLNDVDDPEEAGFLMRMQEKKNLTDEELNRVMSILDKQVLKGAKKLERSEVENHYMGVAKRSSTFEDFKKSFLPDVDENKMKDIFIRAKGGRGFQVASHGAGAGAGIEEDENGRISYNTEKGLAGVAGGVMAAKAISKGKGLLQQRLKAEGASSGRVDVPVKGILTKAREQKLYSEATGGFDPQSYVKEMTKKQELARKTEEGGGFFGRTAKSVGSALSDLKRRLVDTNAPIEDTLAEAQKRFGFESIPKYDITNQIDRVYRAPSIAGQFAKDNGLEDVIKNVDDLDEFDQYLIAKHAANLEKNGIRTGRDANKDRFLVEAVGDKYQKEEAVVRDYSKKLLDYSVETGLIPKQVADNLKYKYPEYVPMKRIFDELEDQGQVRGGSGVASLSSQSVVQRIKGSNREIESPIQSLLQKTTDAFRQGEKNKAAEILTSFSSIPGNPFKLEKIVGGKHPGDNTISILRNGIKETWKTSKEIAEAAKAMNVQQMNFIGKLFAAPVRALKLGATGINPSFIASNVVRDQLSSFINSKNGLRASVLNPVNFAESLWQALGHGKTYDEMIRQGAMQTSFDIGRDQIPATVRNIRGLKTPGILEKAKYVVSTPARLFRAAEDLIGRSEEFTRIQQFNAARDAALAKGMNMENALAVAARAARETSTNFARKGEFGTILNNTIPYLNAGIQGTRTNLRRFKQAPILTGSKLALTLGFPMAAVTAYNLKNEDTRKAYEDIPEYEKNRNIIIIPPNPTQNENGDWEVIKIPITPGHANMAQAARYALERMYGYAPQKFGEIANTLLGSITPVEPTPKGLVSGLTPQAVKPSIESLANRNLYTGFPIVPQSLEDLPKEKQVKEGTSATARKIAETVGASPIKTQAFIQGTFAEAGLNALNASDQAMAKAGVISPEEVGGRSVSESIARRFTSAAGGNVDNERFELQKEGESQRKLENFEKREKVQPVYDEIKKLEREGNIEEAQTKLDALSDEDYETYGKIKTGERSKNTTSFKNLLEVDPKEAAKYGLSLGEEEYARIVDNLSDEEYEVFLQANQ